MFDWEPDLVCRRKMLTNFNLAATGAFYVGLQGQEFGPYAPKFKGPGYLGKLPLKVESHCQMCCTRINSLCNSCLARSGVPRWNSRICMLEQTLTQALGVISIQGILVRPRAMHRSSEYLKSAEPKASFQLRRSEHNRQSVSCRLLGCPSERMKNLPL